MNLGRFMSQAAERRPEGVAFVYGERVTSYAEAEQRSTALAAALSRLGLRRGDRVAVLLWNCPELLETFFGVWKAGGCVVPLNARLLADEIAYHFADAEVSAVVFGEEFSAVVEQAWPQLPSGRHWIGVGRGAPGASDYEQMIEAHRGLPAPDVPGADEDLAWLFYTSGTTGRPKGAMLTHGNLTFTAVAWVADLMHLEPEDVGLHGAPLTHGSGFHALALTMKACPQVILSGRHFDPESFCAAVSHHRVSNTWLVPTQIKLLLRYEKLGTWDLSSLRWVVYGGAPMYVPDLQEAIRRIGPVFVQLFGQGETPMTATYLRREEHVLEGPASARLASCGHARSGIEVQIRESDDQELSRGAVGEICVRGPSVMQGYWRRPEATAETLRGGWLHTGDLGSMDANGYVFILDRSKDLIITGGANVYPREVEEVLSAHPGVAEVCVVGVPDDLWGEAVKALVVPRPGAQITAEEIIAFARSRIADYKRPKSVELLEVLPRNAYGKVLRRELRDRYWAGLTRKV